MCRCNLQILNRTRYRKGRGKEQNYLVIPQHRIEEAKGWLKGEFRSMEREEDNLSMQEMYNKIEEALKKVEDRFGQEKENESTDDKMTLNTKKSDSNKRNVDKH